jgi:AcrR family transcriptional regulator
MTAKTTRKRMPATERRAQIAAVTLELIAEAGFGALTAAALAKRIGVTDAALFRHYDSMEAIVDAAIREFEAVLMDGFPPEHDDPLERLRLFFERRVALCQSQPHVLRLAFDDRLMEGAGAAGARRVRRVVARSRKHIVSCLEQAQREQMIASDIPSTVLTWLIIGVVRGSVSMSGARALDPAELWQSVDKLLRRSRTPCLSDGPP